MSKRRWIALSSAAALALLAAVRYCYNLVFRAPERSEEEQYALPVGEQYDVYTKEIQKSMTEMRERPFEVVQIRSHDGLKLYGRYYHTADGAPVQILFHGYKGSAFREFCGGSKLAIKMGHNVLAVDERSHGRSEGDTITFGIEERRDCLAWIHYARTRFGVDVPIILCGVSMGAATVLMVNDQELPASVKGIVADCPYSSPKEIIQKVGADMKYPPNLIYPFVKAARVFGHFDLEETDALRAVRQAKVPILILHGTDDRFVPHEMSVRLQEANPAKVTLELFPGAGHALCYMIDPGRYEAAVGAFIAATNNTKTE